MKYGLNEYQDDTERFARKPVDHIDVVYASLALCAEAGELANNVKKMVRDNGGILSPPIKHQIINELGDVLWYAAAVARVIDCPLEDVAKFNIAKIKGD